MNASAVVRRGPRNSRRIELIAAAAVIGVLVAVFFRMALEYAEEAEKAAMEQVVSGVRAALHLRVASLMVANDDDLIPALATQNPMDWLADKPHLYVGAFHGEAPLELVPPRSWYYDRRAHQLVYRAMRTRHLETPLNTYKDIRFRVWTGQAELPGGDMLSEPLRRSRRLEFAPVEPYRWGFAH